MSRVTKVLLRDTQATKLKVYTLYITFIMYMSNLQSRSVHREQNVPLKVHLTLKSRLPIIFLSPAAPPPFICESYAVWKHKNTLSEVKNNASFQAGVT